MSGLAWMIGACAISWGAVSLMAGMDNAPEILAGMAGPLAVATTTQAISERTYRRTPERLTALMVKAFAAKMVFFAVYVTIAVAATDLRPVPFVASFTSYFIALHLAEALYLRRLFSDRIRASQ